MRKRKQSDNNRSKQKQRVKRTGQDRRTRKANGFHLVDGATSPVSKMPHRIADRQTPGLDVQAHGPSGAFAMNAGAHDADRPEWFTIIDNDDLTMLAGLLKRLLIMEAAKGTEPEDTPFVGYWKPDANDLLSLPILIALLADLPVSTSLDRAQQLIPVVRALLPDSGLPIVDCIKQHKDETDCLALVDALYAKAASDNSTFVAEVADVLLHRFAIIHRMTGLHHRLVQRFYEVYLAMRPALSSLHDCIIELAHAKLKVQRLANGAPAHTVLNDGQGRSSYRNGSVLEQLAETVAVASNGYADLIAEWLKAKRNQIAETRPDLAEIWAEEDAPLRDNVGDATGKWSSGSRPATSREKATIETLLEQLAELAALVDPSITPDGDQDEESGNGTMDTTGENPNTIGSTAKKGAEPSSDRFSARAAKTAFHQNIGDWTQPSCLLPLSRECRSR